MKKNRAQVPRVSSINHLGCLVDLRYFQMVSTFFDFSWYDSFVISILYDNNFVRITWIFLNFTVQHKRDTPVQIVIYVQAAPVFFAIILMITLDRVCTYIQCTILAGLFADQLCILCIWRVWCELDHTSMYSNPEIDK